MRFTGESVLLPACPAFHEVAGTMFGNQGARLSSAYPDLAEAEDTSQVFPFPAEQEYHTEINGRPTSSYLDWMRSAYLMSATCCPAVAS